MLVLSVATSAPDMLPGPYELEGSILAGLLFLFTAFIFIGKFNVVRIAASFLASITGGAAFIVYYINQTSVGNTLAAGPLIIFGAGFVYGIVIGIILIRGVIHQKELKKQAVERIENQPTVKRRFED